MMVMFHLQWLLDLILAGVSLMVALGMFAFVASILCSAAFIHSATAVP